MSTSLYKSKLIRCSAMTSTKMRAGDELPAHDCRELIDASSWQGQPGPDKHTLESPIESTAKRGKHHSALDDNTSSLGPDGSSIPMPNTLAGTETTASYLLSVGFANNGAIPHETPFQCYDPMLAQCPSVNYATSAPSPSPYANTPLGIFYTQNLILDQIVDIQVLDFVAISTILGIPIEPSNYIYN